MSEQITAADYRDVGLGSAFAKLVLERQQASAEIAALEDAKKTLSEKIGKMLLKRKVTSVVCEGWQPTWAKGKEGSLKLDEKLLLQNGVAADVIAKSKKRGKPGEPHLVVTKVGG